MNITRRVIVFDAGDLDRESAFWAGVLDGSVIADHDWHSILDADGEWCMAVQLAPDHVPPEWPGASPGQQIHLDLHVDDPQAAHQRVLALGATLLQDGDVDAAEGFRVYSDPAGHPFCIGWRN